MRGFVRLRLLALLSILVCGCGDPPQASPAQSKEKPAPAKESQEAALARLIERLGSSDFTEREAATKALETLGFPALDALQKATHSPDAEVARRATRLVAVIENSLDQALADYRTYGLPLPPRDAPLVRFKAGWSSGVNGKSITPYLLGFLLQPATKDQRALVLVGTQEYRPSSETQIDVIEPNADALQEFDPLWRFEFTFELNAGLATALQCKARGWDNLARELWGLSIKEWYGHPYGAFAVRPNLPNRTAVAYLAWVHYANELVKPATDRAAIAQQIQRLLRAEPGLNTEVNQALLKSLEVTLVPSTAKPGSVEQLIDDLTEMCNTVKRGYGESNPRYSGLARMGFAVVPALIEHLDDNRLTRSASGGFNNFPPWIMRVKHIVNGLLVELAGHDVSKNWDLFPGGLVVAKADAQQWWEQARKAGEEQYFVTHVLDTDVKAEWTNSLMLDLKQAKAARPSGGIF